MAVKRLRRPSGQSLLVADALLVDSGNWHYGYALSQQTGLASGTLYPILLRFTESGWLETKWAEPEQEGRPPRHLYRLTAPGVRWAKDVLREARPNPAVKLKLSPERAR